MAEMQAAAGKLQQMVAQEREKAKAKEDELAEQAKREQEEEERARRAAADATNNGQAAPIAGAEDQKERQAGNLPQVPGLDAMVDVVGAAGGYDLHSAAGVIHAAVVAGGQAARKQLVAILADPGAEVQSIVASILGKSPAASSNGGAPNSATAAKKGRGSENTSQGKGIKKARGR